VVSDLARDSLTGNDQIEIAWTALTLVTETGGSPILSYNVQWDKGEGTSTFYELLGYSSTFTSTSHIVTSGIVGGTDYVFKIRALNYWGWGDFSSEVTIRASETPDQMAAVTTAIDPSTGNVVISWVAPTTNSEPITKYKIEIMDSLSAL